MNIQHNIYQLTDHLFRQESGKMVSVLTKVFGIENLETAEDIVQQTFLAAIESWSVKGVPDSPSDWLFLVARNKAIDTIRKNKHAVSYDFSDGERVLLTSEYTLPATMENLWREDPIKDDMLGMMFASCQPDISPESQITLILKTLCGFSTAEIAQMLLTTEDTISKRLYRTKEFFREHKTKLEIPPVSDLKNRTNAVLNSIYLLFNAGYNSSLGDQLIRKDVMAEAMMLGKLLTENKNTKLPEVFALMALMCFHASRIESRLSPEGEIVLLSFQDRSKWDYDLIHLGNCYLSDAAFGDEVSPYHIEAAIAFEHCSAKVFDQTNWKKILELYEWLSKISPSPITELNRTVAIMQVHGPAKALEYLQSMPDLKKLDSFYLYHSLTGEIFTRLDNYDGARASLERALALTSSEMEKKILNTKLWRLSSN